MSTTKDPQEAQDAESRTPKETEVSQETAEKAVPQEKREQSKAVREIGEDRKLLVEGMLKLAEESDTAKETLFSQLDKRPSLKKVAESKFSDRLKALKGEKATVDESKTMEQLKMETKAEMFMEMEAKERKAQTTDLAEKLGMNQEQADSLQSLAEVYAEKRSVDFQTALKAMARAEMPEKAKVLTMPSGSVSADPNTYITDEDQKLASFLSRNAPMGAKIDPKWIAKRRRELEG